MAIMTSKNNINKTLSEMSFAKATKMDFLYKTIMGLTGIGVITGKFRNPNETSSN